MATPAKKPRRRPVDQAVDGLRERVALLDEARIMAQRDADAAIERRDHMIARLDEEVATRRAYAELEIDSIMRRVMSFRALEDEVLAMLGRSMEAPSTDDNAKSLTLAAATLDRIAAAVEHTSDSNEDVAVGMDRLARAVETSQRIANATGEALRFVGEAVGIPYDDDDLVEVWLERIVGEVRRKFSDQEH